MTAPAQSYIRYPGDTGNTGPSAQTRHELVGSDDVHALAFVPRRAARVLGVYSYGVTQGAVASSPAQNGTSTGYLWVVNPVLNTAKNVRVRRMHVSTQLTNNTTPMTTAPRFLASRFTFTGLGIGTALTPAKRASADPTATALLQAAATGWTITLVAQVAAAATCGSLTVVDAIVPQDLKLIDSRDEDEYEVLAAGEGLVVWTDIAGNGAELRNYNLSLLWDEIDIS